MGAYAVPSNQPFIAKNPLKRKRNKGRIDMLMELVSDAHLETNTDTGEMQLIKNGVVVGTFRDEDTEES